MFVNGMNMNAQVFTPHEKEILITLLTVEQSKLAIANNNPTKLEEYESLRQKIAKL